MFVDHLWEVVGAQLPGSKS